jgi:hypothetical protein
MQNMLRTSNDDCRDYFAGEMKDVIGRSIKDELAHLPPDGYKTKPYDPAQWQEYWNDRIYYIYDLGPSSCQGKYRGSTGSEFIAHILRERRANGLPELVIEARNKDRVP